MVASKLTENIVRKVIFLILRSWRLDRVPDQQGGILCQACKYPSRVCELRCDS
jgi:hypothetical protein